MAPDRPGRAGRPGTSGAPGTFGALGTFGVLGRRLTDAAVSAVPADVRGNVDGRVETWRREAERRRIAGRYAAAVAARDRAIRRARSATVRCAGAAALALVAVPLTHDGVADAGLGMLSAAFAARAGWWVKTARQRGRLPVPPPPLLPPSLPPPPPPGSSGWPALHRVAASTTAVRRLVGAVPGDIRPLLEPAYEAARVADGAARGQAARIAAAEAALRTAAPGPVRDELRGTVTALVAGLERAADALELLVATGARLTTGTGGYGPWRELSAATDEVVARTHGLVVAATGAAPAAGPGAAAEVPAYDGGRRS